MSGLGTIHSSKVSDKVMTRQTHLHQSSPVVSPGDAEHRWSLVSVAATSSTFLRQGGGCAAHGTSRERDLMFTRSPAVQPLHRQVPQWHRHVVPWHSICSMKHPLLSPGGDQGACRITCLSFWCVTKFCLSWELLMSSINVPLGETETKVFGR